MLECFLVYIVVTTVLCAQEKKSIPEVEKTYIHTDRSCYTLGEDLWYKAYSVYAYNNLLFNHSNILYVELISPDSKIISRNKTRLEGGIGHGDFKLTDSVGVKAGTYQIRAYTNWNRNFGDDFVFKKDIEILDVFETLTDKNETSNKLKSIAKDKVDFEEALPKFSVQFFPEGGSLIENVSSIVAFKAVDNKGNPIAVEGRVSDSDGEFQNLIISIHDGMGRFKLKPIKGKTYHAKITTTNGDQIEVELPKANAQGYLLSSKKVKDRDIITIKTNQETLAKNLDAPITITCTTRGISYFEGTQPIKNTTVSFELPKTDFPEGISQVTLYDANIRPQSERLIYIEKEHDLEVSLSTDKKSYKPNEKVTVHVSSKTKTGNPVPASYSLSSTDMNGKEATNDYGTNICSYFLMESDIRGRVHNPGYYFDTSNPNRLNYLDLLLLTQGWRDFLWKQMPKAQDSLRYHVEKGMSVRGTVKQLFGSKPKENSSVTLALFNKGKTNMLFSVTDANGRFKFEDMMFMGKTTMLLNTQNEKGKNRGMFVLDSLHQPAMAVDFKSDGIQYSPEINTIKEAMYKKHVLFGVLPENVLDEVVINAKKKEEGPTSLYGTADNTFVVDENTQHFSDVYQLIQFAIPGVTAFGGNVSFARYAGRPAYIMIDGMEWDASNLGSINVDDIAKIEAFKGPSAAIFGGRGGNGVILIYSKEGVISTSTKTVFHSIAQEIEGFYDARQFYSPDLEKPSFEMDNSNAIRNTLYWNPYVFPDETGESQNTYYNSAVETRVKISLEGITAAGIPVVVKTYYTVEK